MINKAERANLYTALGSFLNEFRSYIISFLKERAGDEWIKDFEKTLKKEQQRNWHKDLRRGIKPEELIDFQHLNSFAEEYKDVLKTDFPGKNQSLPIWLLEIADVRHKIAHHNGIDEDEAAKIWIHLRTIAKILGKDELERELLNLENKKAEPQNQKTVLQEARDSKIAESINNVSKQDNYFHKTTVISSDGLPPEILDIVNCAVDDFRQTVFSHSVYLCPAKSGAYNHKRCKYLGIYWEKHVGAISEIEAVIDVFDENAAQVYFTNGDNPSDKYIVQAKKVALELRPENLPLRVFLLKELYKTNLIKDSPGGMFGSKIYLDVKELYAADAEDLAVKLFGRNYSAFGL